MSATGASRGGAPRPGRSREAAACSAALACFAFGASAGGLGCLPGDTRPVPAALNVTVEPSASTSDGLDTADGWRVELDRVLMGVGNVALESDDASCNVYAQARYDRLFDFTVAGREKLGTVYGRGTCRVELDLRDPSFEALLGPGATEQDKAVMRVEGSDRFEDDEGISLIAGGAAVRGGEIKRFEWRFRSSYELTDCQLPGGGLATTVELAEGGALELRIEARAEELFRAAADDLAEIRFQPFADADADADGEVTLDELSKAPRPPIETEGLGPGDAGAPEGPASLEYLVYEESLPRVLRVVGGGPCETENESRR